MTAVPPTSTIAHNQRVAGETVHFDGRNAVSFRLPLGEVPEPQMTVEADLRGDAVTPASCSDVGLLADGPSVWEAISDDESVGSEGPQ